VSLHLFLTTSLHWFLKKIVVIHVYMCLCIYCMVIVDASIVRRDTPYRRTRAYATNNSNKQYIITVYNCITPVIILDVFGRHSYRESENRISCIVPGCQHTVTSSSRHCAIQRYKIAICCAMRSVSSAILSMLKIGAFIIIIYYLLLF